jgi:chemosensory pili system protein ChpC
MSNPNTGIRCLLLPTRGGQLLLPSAVVAEVASYQPPQSISETQPNWLLGLINWREQRVPMLSIEEALSLSTTTVSTAQRSRTIILYGLESNQTLPFYALIAIDVPRPVTITEENITHPNVDARRGLIFNIKINHQESVWLPDLSYLENLLRQFKMHQDTKSPT